MLIRKLSNKQALFWGLFAVGLLLRGQGLSAQPPLDSEVAAASAAANYPSTGLFGQVMWYHPPLRNFVVFLSGWIFDGYSAWGLRFGSVLFGSLTVPALGYLADGLFRNARIGALAAFFLCIDPLHISLSREAFQETTTAFLLVAGVLASLHAIRRDSVPLCYLSGVLFGLSVSSKWHGLFPWAASAAAFAAAPWLLREYPGGRNTAGRSWTVLAAYGVVPITIYIVTYAPWILRGYSLDDFGSLQLWLVKHQYHYKGTAYTEDILSHKAYQWFLWPVAWTDFVFHQGKAYLNLAYGNFAIWVMTLPALVISIKLWFREREFDLGFAIGLFLISYLPLILTTRSIWVFAAPAVIPFAFILIAYAIEVLRERGTITAHMLAIYLAVAVALSALLYPLATFRALDYEWARPLTEFYSPH